MIITLLRKPLEGTVTENTLKHGCGAINIDAIRVGDIVQDTSKNGRSHKRQKSTVFQSKFKKDFEGKTTIGRWPANFILVGDDPIKEIDQQSGIRPSCKGNGDARVGDSGLITPLRRGALIPKNDVGGASRFFKQFKKEDN